MEIKQQFIIAVKQQNFFALSVESSKNGHFMYYYGTMYQNIPGYPPEFVVFSSGNKMPLYIEEEIEYFNFVVNSHILK